MKNSFLVLTLLLLFSGSFHVQSQHNTVLIPKTSLAPVVDGLLGAEWKDATEILLKGLTDQEAKVLVKYDTEYLYIAFQNLISDQHIRYNPEVLINTTIKDTIWNKNSYWFHSSYSNCSSVGEYYNWEDCSANPIGWEANTLPFKKENNNIEFKISFSKLKIGLPLSGMKLRIAFKLSDASELHTYWPKGATIELPNSWGELIF